MFLVLLFLCVIRVLLVAFARRQIVAFTLSNTFGGALWTRPIVAFARRPIGNELKHCQLGTGL